MVLWQLLAVCGIAFLILEMFTPSMFFLNFALASFITAILSFYTKNVYDKYIGIDIEEASDKSQKKVKKQLTEVVTEENLEAENQYIEEINEVDEIKEEYNLSNPTREYFQNDNIQMTPQWTPNAYGNKIEDL